MFYLGAVRFINSLQQYGLPVCLPDIIPIKNRICLVSDSYNANLALRTSPQGKDSLVGVKTNDIAMGSEGRILILTGPNQGGETKYIQGIGHAQLLAQIVCFVPGTHAEIGPVTPQTLSQAIT